MEPNVQEPQHNVSNKGMITNHTFETQSVTPRSGQHVEEPITTFVESLASYVNHLFTGPFVLPLIDPPSTRYFDANYSYRLMPGSTTSQYFGVNPSSFGFLLGLGNSSFSTTPIVSIVGASCLPKTSLT